MVLKKQVGFFGGTFDPIHFGHINLALEMVELCGLDEVLFCPAFCSPFKMATPPIAEAKDRLEMVRLGIEGVPRCKVSAIEVERQGPSFTIDTIRALYREDPKVQYRLILGEEAMHDLDHWKEAQELLRLAPPIFGARRSASAERNHRVTAIRRIDISSTDIRTRISLGLYCGHLVPEQVLAYIAEKHLYTQRD
ncbi:MAG: hypothetical protein RL235_1117 [Chlamydiota bacterium]